MVINSTHTSDWQWQAVLDQMERLRSQGYISKIRQDPTGSTYWTITSKGLNYLGVLERAEDAIEPDVNDNPTATPENSGSIATGPPRSDLSAPLLAKHFGATRISIGRSTSLTFTLQNPNSTAKLTGIAFDDPLPAGLVISEPNGLIGDYASGTVAAPSRGNVIRLSGASLSPRESCSFTVNVTAVDSGPKNNFTTEVTAIEGNPGTKASASLIVMPAGAPIPVSEQLALRLRVNRPNAFHAAMAALIAPRLAVTSFDAVSTQSLAAQPGESIEVESVLTSSVTKNASIIWVDESRNLAVLQLGVEAQFPLPEGLLPSENMPPSDGWEAFVSLPGRPDRIVEGTVGGLITDEGREYWLLHAASPIGDTTAISGAPVVSNGKLVAIVATSSKDGSSLHVISISRSTLQASLSFSKKSSDWLTRADIERFSGQVRSILMRADQIRFEGNRPAVSVSDLVSASVEDTGGQLSELLNLNSGFFLSDYSSLEGPPEEPAFELPWKFPPITREVRFALLKARDKADETSSSAIEDAHLFFGLLSLGESGNLLIQDLNKRGITPNKIKLPTTASQPRSASTLAGYKSDDPIGEDLLDIAKDVNALASVLASKEVDPPLSLGLFGDWGTGKSFFMGCLESRIRELTDDAKRAKGESQYCQDVVQLKFNAWNYIDKDLWASLASEIFEGLATALATKRGGDSKQARALALAATSSSSEIVAETERQKNDAEALLKASEERLADLQRHQKDIKPRLSPREVLNQAARFAIADEDLHRFAKEAAGEVGLAKGTEDLGEIERQILELDSIWSEIVFTIRGNRNLWGWVIAAIAGSSVGTYFLRNYISSDIVKNTLTVLAYVSGLLGAVLAASRKVLSIVRKVKTSRDALVSKTQIAIREKIDDAKKTVEKAAEAVKELNEQLESIRADRQMVDFIRQRYESSDYRANLGTIARVRSDFRHLSALLRDVQQESDRDIIEMKKRQEDKEKERRDHQQKELFPRIDRIILYIDDLDRCPEKNVVEVLQAVHLLLAFPLFVVVVGVDPRWLLRSLKHQTLLSTEDVEKSDRSEEEVQWESTPMNYLEKIFQIPFTLRHINKSGFAKLVDAFATPSAGPIDSQQPKDIFGAPVEGAVQATAASTTSASSKISWLGSESGHSAQEQKTAVAGPLPQSIPERRTEPPRLRDAMSHILEAIDRNPRHLHIEEKERAFMKILYELIPSPRAGKRLINIYRLLRASVDDAEYSAFIGTHASGEYQCALLLLGILTGYPHEAAEILESLIKDRPEKTWGEFLSSIQARVALPANGGDSLTPQASSNTARDRNRWEELFSKLDRIKGNMELRQCTTFVKWAPRVARYSFQSGRALLFERE